MELESAHWQTLYPIMACSSSIIGVSSIHQTHKTLAPSPHIHFFSTPRDALRTFSSSRSKPGAGFSISFVPSAVATPNSSVLSEEAFSELGGFGNVIDSDYGEESEGELGEIEAEYVDELDISNWRRIG